MLTYGVCVRTGWTHTHLTTIDTMQMMTNFALKSVNIFFFQHVLLLRNEYGITVPRTAHLGPLNQAAVPVKVLASDSWLKTD